MYSTSILSKIRKRRNQAVADRAKLKDDYFFSEESKSKEELLREEFPALQDAWEQYQMVLKICKSSKPAHEDTAEEILAQIRAKRNANGIIK